MFQDFCLFQTVCDHDVSDLGLLTLLPAPSTPPDFLMHNMRQCTTTEHNDHCSGLSVSIFLLDVLLSAAFPFCFCLCFVGRI